MREDSARFEENAPVQLYVGYMGETPVATSQMFLGAGVAGTYVVGTLLDYRGRGVREGAHPGSLTPHTHPGLSMGHPPSHRDGSARLPSAQILGGLQGSAFRTSPCSSLKGGFRSVAGPRLGLSVLPQQGQAIVLSTNVSKWAGGGPGRSGSDEIRTPCPWVTVTGDADHAACRAEHLRDVELNPDEVGPLFPNERGTFYSETGWRSARWKVFKELGIRGSYRILRPTFAQTLKDRGARIEEASRALRHTSVATTEKFYARIRNKAAWESLERAWETPSVQKSLIDVKIHGVKRA